jgi:NAD-dependent deacetylase
MELPSPLVAALGRIRSAGVITGAGVSAESGIPTYRGRGGLYDDPAEGDATVEALTGATFRADPDRTWRALARMVRHAGAARPNAAHVALAAMERRLERFVLLTQNVDGLHRAAGSRNVIAIHGDLFRLRCTACAAPAHLGREEMGALAAAPRCAACGGVVRPEVVLFGEMLPEAAVARLHEELLARPPDLVLAVGTTALFPYIRAPVLEARRRGRLTVEVNVERTEISGVVDWFLDGPASAIVPRLAAAAGAACYPPGA